MERHGGKVLCKKPVRGLYTAWAPPRDRHPGKGKPWMEMDSRSVARGRGEEGMKRQSTEGFRAVELLCVASQCWTRVLQTCQSPGDAQHQNCPQRRLWTLGDTGVQRGLRMTTKASSCCENSGRAGRVWGWGYVGTLYFQLCWGPRTALKNKVISLQKFPRMNVNFSLLITPNPITPW